MTCGGDQTLLPTCHQKAFLYLLHFKQNLMGDQGDRGDQGPQLEAVKPLLDDFRHAAGASAPRSLGCGGSGASTASAGD